MSDFNRLKTTLTYARLGLVSLTAAIAPITATAQELCGTDLFEGEPDADALLSETLSFLEILQTNGVVAFKGIEGRITVTAAQQALQDGVGSASLLACVVNSEAIEFAIGAENQIIGCDAAGAPSIFQTGSPSPVTSTGQLFCTGELTSISKYMGSES